MFFHVHTLEVYMCYHFAPDQVRVTFLGPALMKAVATPPVSQTRTPGDIIDGRNMTSYHGQCCMMKKINEGKRGGG